MSNRELMTWAAKAVGYKTDGIYDPQLGLIVIHPTNPLPFRWNPLNDDGDNFRLIVELKLEVVFLEGFSEIQVSDDVMKSNMPYEDGDDLFMLTRLAAVTCAAEAGRRLFLKEHPEKQ